MTIEGTERREKAGFDHDVDELSKDRDKGSAEPVEKSQKSLQMIRTKTTWTRIGRRRKNARIASISDGK